MSLKIRRGLEAQRTGITPAEGEIIYTTDQKRLFVGDGTTPGGNGVSSPVTSVNSQVGAVSLTSSMIPEGGDALNKYFTNARAQAAISGGAGISISNGVISSNITQYTDELAQDAVWAMISAGEHSNISFSYDDNTNSLSVTSNSANDTFKTITVSPNIYFSNLVSGSLYTKTPTITIERGVGDTTGEGATAQVLLIPASIASIAITTPGSGYLSAPSITFTGGGDQSTISHATATCTISGGAINTVTITYVGQGYTSLPSIVIGGAGGAVLTPSLNPTGVNKVELITAGTSYTADPVAIILPGAGDTTGAGAEVTASLSLPIVAAGTTDTLPITAGSGIILNTNSSGALVITAKNYGEVVPGTEGNLSFYLGTGSKLSGTRGLAWVDHQSLFQVGSESQGVNGNMRIVRNNYSAAAGTGFIFEQYHATQDTVNFNFLRGRGTQNTPASVTTSDKLGDIGFGGYDTSATPGAVFGAQITARVDGTVAPTKMPVRLEFYTRNEAESVASAAMFLYGNKTATFFGPVHLHRYTTAQRDAIPGLGAGTVGYIIYNTDLNKFQGYQNTGGSLLEWVDLS